MQPPEIPEDDEWKCLTARCKNPRGESEHLRRRSRCPDCFRAHKSRSQRVRRALAAGHAHQLPADAGQLPADAGQLPSDAGQLPSNADQLPADAGQLPSDAGQLPADAGRRSSWNADEDDEDEALVVTCPCLQFLSLRGECACSPRAELPTG